MNAEVIDFDTATIDELVDWAKENYPAANLNKRGGRDAVAAKCKKLAGVDDGDGAEDVGDDEQPAKPSRRPKTLPAGVAFLQHPENGRVFKATQELWKRGDMTAHPGPVTKAK